MGGDLWGGLAAGAVATGLAAIALGTVEGIPSEPPVSETGSLRPAAAAPAPSGAPTVDCAAPQTRRDALRQEVASARRRVAALEAGAAWARGQVTAVVGEAQRWPADLPEGFRPERFEAELASRLAEHEGLVLEAVDCSEHPCAALIRVEGYLDASPSPGADRARSGALATVVMFAGAAREVFEGWAQEGYGADYTIGSQSGWNGATEVGHVALAAYPAGNGELDKRVDHRLDLLMRSAASGGPPAGSTAAEGSEPDGPR